MAVTSFHVFMRKVLTVGVGENHAGNRSETCSTVCRLLVSSLRLI